VPDDHAAPPVQTVAYSGGSARYAACSRYGKHGGGVKAMELVHTVASLITASRLSASCYRVASERLTDDAAIAHYFDEQADYHDLAADWLEKKLGERGDRPVPEILQAPSPEGWSYPAVGESNPGNSLGYAMPAKS